MKLNQIFKKLTAGEFHGSDYAFDFNRNEWIHLNEIQVFKDLRLKFPTSNKLEEVPKYSPYFAALTRSEFIDHEEEYLFILHQFRKIYDEYEGLEAEFEKELSETQSKLTKEIEHKTYLVETLSKESEDKNTVISQIQEDLSSAKQEVESASNELKKKELIVSGLSSELKKREETIEGLQEHLKLVENQKKEVQEAKRGLESDLDHINKEFDDYKKEQERQKGSLRFEIQELQAKLEKKNNEIKSLKKEKDSAIERFDIVDDKCKTIERNYERALNMLDTQRSKDVMISDVIGHLVKVSGGNFFDLSEKEEKIVALEAELNELLTKKAELSSTLERRQAEISDISLKTKTWEEKYHELKKRHEETKHLYEEAIKRNEKDDKRADQRFQQMVSEMEGLTQANQLLTREKYDLLDAQYRRVQEVEDEKDKLSSDNFRLQTRCETYETDIKIYKNEIEKLKEKVTALRTNRDVIIEDQRSEDTKSLDDLYVHGESKKISALMEKIQKLTIENNRFAEDNKKLIKQNETYKNQLDQVKQSDLMYKEKFMGLKNENQTLLVNLQKLNANNQKKTEQIQDLTVVIHDLKPKVDKYEELIKQQEEEELARLVGDSFEVQSGPVWQLKGQEDLPMSFEALLSMKEDGELDPNDEVKTQFESTWQKVSERMELNVELTEHTTASGDIRYFLQRKSYRAPIFTSAKIEVHSNTIRGNCTSISEGGCFIEINKIDNSLIVIGDRVVIEFGHDIFPTGFKAEVEIKNISQKRPRGIGVAFSDIGETELKYIKDYVEHYKRNEKKAA